MTISNQNPEWDQKVKVMRHGKEVELTLRELHSDSGLSLPTAPQDKYQELDDDITREWGQGQPALNVVNPDDMYGKIHEVPIQEHESLPTFNMLPDNRNIARKLNLGRDPYAQ